MQGAEVKGEIYQKLRGGEFSKNPLHWVPLFGTGEPYLLHYRSSERTC